MNYKYLVKGFKKSHGSEIPKEKFFYCLEDAEEFAKKCNWDDVEVIEIKFTVSERTESSSVLESKAVNAAARYLRMHDYEILDRDFSCNYGSVEIVAEDSNGVIAFVDVVVRTEGELASSDKTRTEFELITADWIKEHLDHVDCPVRADEISMLVLGDHNALIRHYVNRFGKDF